MVALSLDCLSLTDTSPADTIRAAATAGFDHVSLWFSAPAAFTRALVRPEQERELTRLMADSGVTLHSIEPFDLASADAILSYRPALELGARLGGKAALAYHGTPHDGAGAAELLALFADVAAEFGLGLNLEPVAMGQTRTLAQARDLIRASGAKARLLVDFWHLMRSGGTLANLRAIPPEMIGYVQINDGLILHPPEDMVMEAMGERPYPGEGEFPLAELLALLPRDVVWGVECPSLRRAKGGMDATAQAQALMASLRAVMAPLEI